MKKLMFAVVAVAAGVSFADVQSANIVGYGQADLNQQYTGVGPMFFAIGEDVTSVQNLSVEGVTSASGTGYTIAPITSTGNIPVNYYYFKGIPAQFNIPDGWYTTSSSSTLMTAAQQGKLDEYVAKIDMAKGEGLVTFMGNTGRALRGTGEVLMEDQTIPLNQQYTGVANPFPVDVDIQNYEILGVTSASGTGYTIAPITSTGNIPVNYYYFKGIPAQFNIPDGWYTTSSSSTLMQAAQQGKLDEYLVDYTFKPGEAAVTFMGAAGRSLKIKCPIATK